MSTNLENKIPAPTGIELKIKNLQSQYSKLPSRLKDKKSWLVWRKRPKANDPTRFDKVPYYAASGRTRSGQQGTEDDRRQLVTFDVAIQAMVIKGFNGIGIAMLPGNGFSALDFDHCIDEQGDIADWAMDLLNELPDIYVERSPSKTGLRAFIPDIGIDKKNHQQGFEVFSHKGFVTVTGDCVFEGDLS
jgi:putative DNA primase/helicase